MSLPQLSRPRPYPFRTISSPHKGISDLRGVFQREHWPFSTPYGSFPGVSRLAATNQFQPVSTFNWTHLYLHICFDADGISTLLLWFGDYKQTLSSIGKRGKNCTVVQPWYFYEFQFSADFLQSADTPIVRSSKRS